MGASSSRQSVNLENKVALVTGAAQGIGLGATKALLREWSEGEQVAQSM